MRRSPRSSGRSSVREGASWARGILCGRTPRAPCIAPFVSVGLPVPSILRHFVRSFVLQNLHRAAPFPLGAINYARRKESSLGTVSLALSNALA
jgi:hypothetical protein